MKFNIPDNHKYESGIYIIINSINKKFYIGSAVNLRLRATKHCCDLNSGTHCNSKLQRFVNKYGLENLGFQLLELCSKEELIGREQNYLDSMQAVKKGFNLSPTAGSVLGRIVSDATKKKISLSKLGKTLTLETKEKLRQANLGKKLTPEHIRKATSHLIGRKKTKEEVEKIKKGRLKHSLDNKILIKKICPVCKVEFLGYPYEKENCSMECFKDKTYKLINQYDLNGKFIQSFKGFSDASRQLKLDRMSVLVRCLGELKKADGFILRFENEEIAETYRNGECSFCKRRFYNPKNKKKTCSYICRDQIIKQTVSS